MITKIIKQETIMGETDSGLTFVKSCGDETSDSPLVEGLSDLFLEVFEKLSWFMLKLKLGRHAYTTTFLSINGLWRPASLIWFLTECRDKTHFVHK